MPCDAQALDRGVAVAPRRQLDHVDEPAAPVAAGIGARQVQPLDARQPLGVERGHRRARGEHLVQVRQLGDAERAGQVRQPVVEAQPVVVEPAHVRRAALVALGVHPRLRRRRRGTPALHPPPWSAACWGRSRRWRGCPWRPPPSRRRGGRRAPRTRPPPSTGRARRPAARARACRRGSRRCAPAAGPWCARSRPRPRPRGRCSACADRCRRTPAWPSRRAGSWPTPRS